METILSNAVVSNDVASLVTIRSGIHFSIHWERLDSIEHYRAKRAAADPSVASAWSMPQYGIQYVHHHAYLPTFSLMCRCRMTAASTAARLLPLPFSLLERQRCSRIATDSESVSQARKHVEKRMFLPSIPSPYFIDWRWSDRHRRPCFDDCWRRVRDDFAWCCSNSVDIPLQSASGNRSWICT